MPWWWGMAPIMQWHHRSLCFRDNRSKIYAVSKQHWRENTETYLLNLKPQSKSLSPWLELEHQLRASGRRVPRDCGSTRTWMHHTPSAHPAPWGTVFGSFSFLLSPLIKRKLWWHPWRIPINCAILLILWPTPKYERGSILPLPKGSHAHSM